MIFSVYLHYTLQTRRQKKKKKKNHIITNEIPSPLSSIKTIGPKSSSQWPNLGSHRSLVDDAICGLKFLIWELHPQSNWQSFGYLSTYPQHPSTMMMVITNQILFLFYKHPSAWWCFLWTRVSDLLYFICVFLYLLVALFWIGLWL